MVYLSNLFLLFSFCKVIFAPPIPKAEGKFELFNDIHYKSYLQEVIKELEGDEKFAEEVKSAQEHNRTEHIARSLLFVNHNIRNKLDEIKRKEINRLNILEMELERRKMEKEGKKVPPADLNFEKEIIADKDHIDHSNPLSFEMADLMKLIQKTEEDLKIVDKRQEEAYKEHEIKKDYLKKKKIESFTDPKKQEEVSKHFEEAEKRHEIHPKVHHPGNQEQLKEVWQKSDHLDPNDFNPKFFFDMHDINNDGHLDINEVEALMQTELSKVYEANNTDDDMQEKYHEMMRMRQEMMRLMDKNGDNLISKEEFLEYSRSASFKLDSDWKTQEETHQKPYTDEEYKEFTGEIASHDGQGEDLFSDQDESLRYIPKEFNLSEQPTINDVTNHPPAAAPQL